jgi:hypothetical protein
MGSTVLICCSTDATANIYQSSFINNFGSVLTGDGGNGGTQPKGFLNIANSTFSGNTQGYTVIAACSNFVVNVTNTTLADNVNNSYVLFARRGTLNLRNSIITAKAKCVTTR